MNFRLEINLKDLQRRFKNNIDKAQIWFDKEVIADTDPSAMNHTIIGSGQIVYNENNREEQYFNQQSPDIQPDATWPWFESAKAVNGKKWIAGVKKRGGQ